MNERYIAVSSLFNGDVHLVIPEYAPRQDWIVVSKDRIIHIGQSTIDAAQQGNK